MILIYTDGSAKRNGTDNSIGGYGIVVVDKITQKVLDAYQKNNIPNTTNNRMELTAIIAASVLYEHYYPFNLVSLYSDSTYAIKSLFEWREKWKENDWKKSNGEKVLNLDLIQEFDELREINTLNFFEKTVIPGHSGNLFNELADKLATGEITVNEVMEKYG